MYKEIAIGSILTGSQARSKVGVEKPSEQEIREAVTLLTTIVWTSISLGIVTIIGGLTALSKKMKRIRIGSTIALGASVVNAWLGGGFVVGSLIGIIAGVIGLFWEPRYKIK